jgi:hypothetical protein
MVDLTVGWLPKSPTPRLPDILNMGVVVGVVTQKMVHPGNMFRRVRLLRLHDNPLLSWLPSTLENSLLENKGPSSLVNGAHPDTLLEKRMMRVCEIAGPAILLRSVGWTPSFVGLSLNGLLIGYQFLETDLKIPCSLTWLALWS